jgi:PAS domain S-box-containing protein
MFGYSRAELVGQPLELLVPHRFREQHAAYRSTYLDQPGFRPMGAGLNLYGLRRDGREFPIEVSLSPIETEDGPLVMSAIRDITERKRAEEDLLQSERFNERITSTLPYIIYVFDIVERRNIYSNQQMLHFLGYTPQEIRALGSDFLPKLLHPDDLIHLQELLQRWDTATDSEIIETEYRM